MPYIKPEERRALRTRTAVPDDAGQLNFAITEIVLDYMERKGRRYETMNEIVGALECAKLEFQRRAIAPYEDAKIAQNGDLYGYFTV